MKKIALIVFPIIFLIIIIIVTIAMINHSNKKLLINELNKGNSQAFFEVVDKKIYFSDQVFFDFCSYHLYDNFFSNPEIIDNLLKKNLVFSSEHATLITSYVVEQLGVMMRNEKRYDIAKLIFERIIEYENLSTRYFFETSPYEIEAKYQIALILIEMNLNVEAYDLLMENIEYKDARDICSNLWTQFNAKTGYPQSRSPYYSYVIPFQKGKRNYLEFYIITGQNEWHEAFKECENLKLNNLEDWKMVTRDEFIQIYYADKKNQYLLNYGFYWIFEEDKDDSHLATFFYLTDEPKLVKFYSGNKNGGYQTVAVRSI